MYPVSLLAPVPEEHLISGQDVVAETGRVAFGSRAWQVFRELDELREGQPIDVYIYASYPTLKRPPKVRWKGRYIGHVEAIVGAHPDGMANRPKTTGSYDADNRGYWAIFWELDRLSKLQNDEVLSMSVFRGFNSDKVYNSSFIPEGPTLVKAL